MRKTCFGLLAVLLFVLPAQQALARCGLVPAAETLFELSKQHAWGQKTLTVAQAAELRDAIKIIETLSKDLELRDSDRRTVSSLLLGLTDMTSAQIRAGSLIGTGQISKQLIALERALRIACGNLNRASRRAAVIRAEPEGELNGGSGKRDQEEYTSQDVLIFFVGVLALLGLLFTARSLLSRVLAWFVRQHFCKIGACLWIGDDLVDGEVSILGRRKCQFTAREDGAEQAVRQAVLTYDAALVIEDVIVPCDVWSTNGDIMIVAYEVPLRPNVVRRLLKKSKTTPTFAPRQIWPRNNVLRKGRDRPPAEAYSSDMMFQDLGEAAP